MKPLVKALKETNHEVPVPYDLPIVVEPGFTVLVIAAPRVGKSMLALNWALEFAARDMPVLYHSTDTDFLSQAVRLVSACTDLPMSLVMENRDYWAEWLKEQDLPIRWNQESITYHQLPELVEAETEYLGEPPALVIVDVLADLVKSEEAADMQQAFKACHMLGKKTGSVMLLLNHVKKDKGSNGMLYVSPSDGIFAGDRVAEVVLTMWRNTANIVNLLIGKNRQGKDGDIIRLRANYEKASFRRMQ